MKRIGKQKTQICPKGHNKDIVGKTKSGACKECRKLRQRKDPTIDSRIIRHKFCPKGHNKDVTGRYSDGSCAECRREKGREVYIPHPRSNRFCKREHDTSIVGRNNNGKGNCKICADDYNEQYYDANQEELIKQKKEYYYANHDVVLERERVYSRTHRDSINENIRCKTAKNINFKLAKNLRSRLLRAIERESKRGSAVKDLGCSIEFLKSYIEDKFYANMTWNNWGKV